MTTTNPRTTAAPAMRPNDTLKPAPLAVTGRPRSSRIRARNSWMSVMRRLCVYSCMGMICSENRCPLFGIMPRGSGRDVEILPDPGGRVRELAGVLLPSLEQLQHRAFAVDVHLQHPGRNGQLRAPELGADHCGSERFDVHGGLRFRPNPHMVRLI